MREEGAAFPPRPEGRGIHAAILMNAAQPFRYSTATRLLLNSLATSGGLTNLELTRLTAIQSVGARLHRLMVQGHVTRDGSRSLAGADGRTYTSSLWHITASGRRLLASQERDASEAETKLTRVHGWLVKATHPDMTGEGRQACVLLALDEIRVTIDTGEETAA